MQATPYFDALHGSSWQAAVRGPLLELNAQVAEAVASARPPLAPPWRTLPPEARERAADFPCLLLDLGLSRPGPWPPGPSAAARQGVSQGAGPLPLDAGLLRRTLLFAWHLVHAHGFAAGLVLGASPSAAAALAACRLAALERLAEQRPAWLAPRWLEHPMFWQAWFAACVQGRRAELERLRFWGLQRLAAEVAPPPAAAAGQLR